MELKPWRKNILFYREKKGLSQASLGSLLGVTNKTISNWEKGISSPDLDEITKLAIIF